MSYSRRKFLLLAGATSLSTIVANKLLAQGIPQEILNQVLPLPGTYGEDYGKAKIRAFHLHNQPKTSPLHKALEEMWLEVFKRSEGELFISPIPEDAHIPAGDPQAVQFITNGRFEVVSVAAPILDKLSPDAIAIQNLPFIYQSADEVFEVINKPLFAEALNNSVAQYNLIYLPNGTFDNGIRNVTSVASKPINTVEDFKDLIIRIPPSNDMAMTMKALGANPQQFTMNQVFEVLKNGTVEAQENPMSVAKGFKLYEVTKYLNLTGHAWSGYNTFFNTTFWNGISPATQNIIREILPVYQLKQRKAQAEYNQQAFKELTEDKGMIALTPDTSEVPKKLIPIYQSIYNRLNPSARSLVKDLLEAKTGVKFD